MTWQPIETAPRDGTRILGWSADYQLVAAIAYDADFQCWVADNEECWFEGNGETSHWMPLPPPPPTTEEPR